METTFRAPNVPIEHFKRTKIIATLGPSTGTYESVLKLIKAGANGLRLNFGHGTHEDHAQRVKWVRKAAIEYGKPVAIIQDLQGPKLRLGDFEGVINVKNGQDLRFKYLADFERSGLIPTQYDLSTKLKRGERIYLYDGKVRAMVTSVKDGIVHTTAETDGILIRRKGINVPDTDFGGDIVTHKDREDIAFSAHAEVDYVAMSFVQSAADIHKLRTLIKNLNSHARIIAKIETKAAVDNLEEITEAADAVMIARGDLAVETMLEAVPITQARAVEFGIKYAKPTIVATQMMASMVLAPEPTRAEVSDIATAVREGADCLMLSDETASGNHPIESVKVMKRVINYVQNNTPQRFSDLQSKTTNRQHAISAAVINLAESVGATAVVAETKSGATALQIASERPDIPLIAVTSVAKVANQLAIVYGVKSYVRPDDKMAATKLTNWLKREKVLSTGDIVVSASGRYAGVVGTTDTIKVRVL